MNILVDSSVWIDYFRGGKKSADLDLLIDENLIAVNDLILAELVPFLKVKRELNLIKLLNTIRRTALLINWQNIIEMQTKCLKEGINKVGIPDLIHAQHAISNKLKIYTLDKHFALINRHTDLELYNA